MNETDPILVVERGPSPSLRYPLELEQVTVGRSAGNQLVLADPEISRRHLRVVKRADGYAVEDMGSTNGTFVNGQRISHLTLLQDGDTIDLGDTVRLRFVAPQPAIVAPAAPATPAATVNLAERPTQAFRPTPAESASSPASAPPAPPPVAPAPRPAPAAPPPQPVYTPPPTYAYQQPRRGRGLLIGCGLLVALLLVCAGTFLLLDNYQDGRLLYCGAARPFFELVLGPFGFAPICP